MRRWLRPRIVVPITAIAIVAIVAGVRLYSQSDAAKDDVQEKLAQRLGTKVRIDGLTVGFSDTTISNVRIHEHDAGDDSEPFITVRNVDVDVATVGAILGRDPSTIRLRDASVLLRFDRQGNLLTKLPSKGEGGGDLPTIRISSGTLTIRQEGRADSVFRGVDLTVKRDNDELSISGDIDDPSWGRWKATGSIPMQQAGEARFSFRTAEVRKVDPDLLARVPLVHPNAWKHVKLAGKTTGQFDLSIDMSTEATHYRIALEPVQASVEIVNIGLKVTDAAGSFVAEDGIITLKNVRGQAADGVVQVDSRMDFSTADSALRFQANLSRLDVRQLPTAWKLPTQLEGRLSGQVDLTFNLPESGGTRIEAKGQATVYEARLQGRPVPPIELHVGSDSRGGLAFVEPPTKVAKQEPKKTNEPAPVEPPVVTTRRPGLVNSALRLAARMAKVPDPPKNERSFLPVYVTFRDIDVAELLKVAGVEGSIPVGGTVTAKLLVEIPDDTPDDYRQYRITGTIEAREFTIDQLAINDVTAKLDMVDGKLTVRDLTGRLPGSATKVGPGSIITIQGEVEVTKPYAFRATAKVDDAALKHFEQLKTVLPTEMTWEGEVSAEGEFRGSFSPFTLQTKGHARAKRLTVGAIPAQDLSFRWQSDGDAIRFKDASVKVFSGKITGEFDVPLRPEVAGRGTATIDDVDLAEASKALMADSGIKLEGKANGTVTMRTPPVGDGGARGPTAEIDLQSTTMKLQGIQAKKIKGTGAFAAGVFKYNLAGAALGGQIEVSGQYPPEKRTFPKPPLQKTDAGLDFGKLRVKRIQLSSLWDVLGMKTELGSFDAEISGEFPLTTDSEGRLVGNGKLRAERLRWKDKELAASAQGIVRLTPKSFILDEATLFAGEGVARIHATFNRADPDKSEASLSLTNVPADRLLFLFPAISKRMEMNVDGRLTTTIGREWRGSGVLTSSKGKIYGIAVTDVRAPIDWVVLPSRDRAEIKLRDAAAVSSGGTMAARAQVSMFSDLPPRLSGEVQFRNANVSQAFQDAGRVVGNLQITGKLEFAAEQYRTMDDLTAKFDAKLGESQPFNLPVFAALVPFLGVGRDYSTTIREGEAHAVLGRGVWKVQQLTLSGPSIDMFADGTVTLDGRLNGSVVVRSGERPSQAVLRRFMPATPISNLTPTNLTLNRNLLTDATSLVGNNVIYLEVTGTTKTPAVRVQALRTLSEAVVRFFLFRFLVPIPT